MLCIICGIKGCDPSHIRSYSVTLNDDILNLVPLCRKHHSEQHQIGILTFIKKYPTYWSYIKRLGWEIDNGKLYNPALNK